MSRGRFNERTEVLKALDGGAEARNWRLNVLCRDGNDPDRSAVDHYEASVDHDERLVDLDGRGVELDGPSVDLDGPAVELDGAPV